MSSKKRRIKRIVALCARAESQLRRHLTGDLWLVKETRRDADIAGVAFKVRSKTMRSKSNFDFKSPEYVAELARWLP